MSSFSRSIRSTMPPIGSSTSGIQRSSRSVIPPGLWPFLPGPPRDLGGDDDQQAGEELAQRFLRNALGDLRAADRRANGGDTDDERIAHPDVALLAPDTDGDRRDHGEQRRRLCVELGEPEPGQGRHEEDAAADAEEPGEHAGEDPEEDGEDVRHLRKRSTAIPTRSAANAYDRVRVRSRCCKAVPPSAPAAAGKPSNAA